MTQRLELRGHTIPLPAFLPDATFGYVRTLTAQDLHAVGVQAVMMNAFHLMQKPGSSVVSALGGLHRMSGWDGVIMTDSGGFQAYSLIWQNSRYGSIGDNGIIFHPEGSDRRILLTPEKSIQLQMSYGADILICLDDCTHASASYQEQKAAVERTVSWAARAKREFKRQVETRQMDEANLPLLFAVIQGGAEQDLRQACAEALLEIGFDGFGFGGWPLDENSQLLTDILQFTRSVVPEAFQIHALGIGHPQSVATSFRLGYQMFDCAMPTRDARHGRLYAWSDEAARPSIQPGWFHYVYLDSEAHMRSKGPISARCTCPCCSELSLGYLHHLYRMQDPAAQRLATQHNLRFMTQLMEDLRSQSGS